MCNCTSENLEIPGSAAARPPRSDEVTTGSFAFPGYVGAFLFRCWSAGAMTAPMASPAIRSSLRILGIDPGLRRTGWGVVESEGNRLAFIACGSVEPPEALPLSSRLLAIHDGLAAVLREFTPAEAAVEQTFVNKDGVATLKLGQARGIAMLVPAMFGIAVAEYAPNQVKKTVVGAGHADKSQIAVMLKILLPRAEPKSPDAADALAIAITHAHHRQGAALRLKVAAL